MNLGILHILRVNIETRQHGCFCKGVYKVECLVTIHGQQRPRFTMSEHESLEAAVAECNRLSVKLDADIEETVRSRSYSPRGLMQ